MGYRGDFTSLLDCHLQKYNSFKVVTLVNSYNGLSVCHGSALCEERS